MSDTIWSRRNAVEAARREKLREAMGVYDEEIYRPALNAIRKECAAVGHTKGKFHNNGLGYCWWYCSKCGGRMDVTDENGNLVDATSTHANNGD